MSMARDPRAAMAELVIAYSEHGRAGVPPLSEEAAAVALQRAASLVSGIQARPLLCSNVLEGSPKCIVGSSGRPRTPYRQRCAVRVIYSQNKTHGQWKAHGRYIMREAASRNSAGHGAFNDGEQAKDFVAMQRANDRQKMLAAHGALLSDERLQLVAEDLRKLKLLEGRVVLQGEEEAGREAGGTYLLLEGTEGRLHHVYYTPEIPYARSLGKLQTNSFIGLRRMSAEDGRPTLQVDDLGDAEKPIQNKRHSLEGARRLFKHDITPVEDGSNGWFGRYQSAIVLFAVDQIEAANTGAIRAGLNLEHELLTVLAAWPGNAP
jgi:hypothetical protein